jgi:putative hydrolases of HD superfamily
MQQIAQFILELDKLKGVTRKNRPLGLDRFENSAEHSWQIALLALSLAPHAEEALDVNRVVGMLLVHDIGEIDTGDTIVYAVDGWEERKAAELAAVKRIFGILNEPQRSLFLELWLEFDRCETPEARFAHAADRAMPALLNLANNGQSWIENGISYERVINRIGPPIAAGCPALWRYLAARLEEEWKKGWFGAGSPQ